MLPSCLPYGWIPQGNLDAETGSTLVEHMCILSEDSLLAMYGNENSKRALSDQCFISTTCMNSDLIFCFLN